MSSMTMMDRGMTMGGAASMSSGISMGQMPNMMPGMMMGGMPSAAPGMMMVPKCSMKMEKISGGMRVTCVCEDKTSAMMLQNLCSMMAGGMMGCCMMMNGMMVC